MLVQVRRIKHRRRIDAAHEIKHRIDVLSLAAKPQLLSQQVGLQAQQSDPLVHGGLDVRQQGVPWRVEATHGLHDLLDAFLGQGIYRRLHVTHRLIR